DDTPLTMHLVEALESRCLLSAAVRPDLLIKNKTESGYVGDNVYNATGQNQSRSAPGGFYPTIYHLRIQNDGTSTDSFALTATGTANPSLSDTVTATTTYTIAPGVEIRRENFDSSGVYLATVQNFGNVIDRMKITGPAAGRSYTVAYFDAAVGGNDITAAVTG